MPKMKSNKGAAKRFKKTAGGFKFKHATKRHILLNVLLRTSVSFVQMRFFQHVKLQQLHVCFRSLNSF